VMEELNEINLMVWKFRRLSYVSADRFPKFHSVIAQTFG
jgi:hypothetical protein